MSSVVEAQSTTSTPLAKKKKVQEPVPLVDTLNIEHNYLEEESIPFNFSCPITIPFSLPVVVSIARTSIDPLDGLMVEDSFPEIHFSEITTTTIVASHEPSSIPMSIPIIISSDILVPHATTIDQSSASIENVSTQPAQVKIYVSPSNSAIVPISIVFSDPVTSSTISSFSLWCSNVIHLHYPNNHSYSYSCSFPICAFSHSFRNVNTCFVGDRRLW